MRRPAPPHGECRLAAAGMWTACGVAPHRYVLCVMYGLLIALYAGSFIWDAARDKASPPPARRTHTRARTATVLVAVVPCAA